VNDPVTFSCMVPGGLRLERWNVSIQQLNWDSAWDELLHVALYNRGPDVSEVGTTWLANLVEMDALWPLTELKVRPFWKRRNFLPASWQGGIIQRGQLWALPFSTDTRVIYYRRDWLKRAGIQEGTAFETPDSFQDTLARLQASGVETPLAMPTTGLNVLYVLASWVWGAGGRFRAADGRRLRLDEPQAQAGMRACLDLHRFLSPAAQGRDIVASEGLFSSGQAATVIGGPWFLGLGLLGGSELLPDVGVAPVPGVPYVGGSNLVVWRHTLHTPTAAELLKHLTSIEVQRHFFETTGVLPARVEVLESEPFTSDPHYQALARSLKSGRTLKIFHRWAAIEQRLVHMLTQLWSDLARDPQLDLENEVASRTTALIDNLGKTILATW
jgi:multiple sugar transport system substrate-binding protein